MNKVTRQKIKLWFRGLRRLWTLTTIENGDNLYNTRCIMQLDDRILELETQLKIIEVRNERTTIKERIK